MTKYEQPKFKKREPTVRLPAHTREELRSFRDTHGRAK